VRSKNLVSIRLLQQVGLPAASEWVARYGFDAAKQPDNLTFALGAGSTTPLQLALAYAVLANGGHRVEPVLIERIVDRDGTVLFEAAPAAALTEARRVLPARNAFVMGQLLGEVVRSGTGAAVQSRLPRSDLAGKTGTTDEGADAWFAGFHQARSAVVWIGYSDPRSLGTGASGGGLAMPVWTEVMAAALRNVPVAVSAPPAGVSWMDGDWRYDEWAMEGWIARIEADGPFGSRAIPAVAPAASSPQPLDTTEALSTPD
jgi:penicillin-binding protein 1A